MAQLDDEIRDLAEDYLKTHIHLPYDSHLRSVIIEEMERWERQQKTLPEDDPLYEVRERTYEKNKRRWLRTLGEESPPPKRFLRAISERFTAQGVWLEPTVLRAVNLALGREYREWLVVDGVKLEADHELTGERILRAAMAVRELATRELQSDSGYPPIPLASQDP